MSTLRKKLEKKMLKHIRLAEQSWDLATQYGVKGDIQSMNTYAKMEAFHRSKASNLLAQLNQA